MKILLIEDDESISSFLKIGLKREGYLIDLCDDGKKGLFLAITNDYDLIILDITLPNLSGKDICSRIRAENKNYPIIVLTASFDVNDKIYFLNIGADDYLTKPFSFSELIARIKAITRRSYILKQNSIYQIGDLVLDDEKKLVTRENKVVMLTRKEYLLLKYLLKNKNIVISRNTLFEHVWDMNSNPWSNTLETHIRNLRVKIDKKRKKKYIHTVAGVGYKVAIE